LADKEEMNYSSKEQQQRGHGQSQPHLSDGLQMAKELQ
jgi:hypothetical protein